MGNQTSEAALVLETHSRPLISGKDWFPLTELDFITPPLKRCRKCKEWKPATTEYFSKRADARSGLYAQCRVCRYNIHRQWIAEHPDKVRELKIRWDNAHREQRRATVRRWDASHSEQRRSYRRRRRVETREHRRKWIQNHPAQVTAIVHQRRARKLDLPDTFMGAQLVRALTYWHWKCAYCGKSLAQLSMFENIQTHFDHFIPLSDRRPGNPGTVAVNMLPTCRKCNCQKHNSDPIDWINRKFGAREAKRIIAAIQTYFNSLKPKPGVS